MIFSLGYEVNRASGSNAIESEIGSAAPTLGVCSYGWNYDVGQIDYASPSVGPCSSSNCFCNRHSQREPEPHPSEPDQVPWVVVHAAPGLSVTKADGRGRHMPTH